MKTNKGFYCSVAQSCRTLCNPHGVQHARIPCPSLYPFLKLISIESMMPSSHLILFPPSPPALNLSQHKGLFQWVGSSHQVAKVLGLYFCHQFFQWIFRVDFLAVQGTFKSLLQHHDLKVSIFQGSAFFMVQLSHPYMTTGKP